MRRAYRLPLASWRPPAAALELLRSTLLDFYFIHQIYQVCTQ
jgi:hypothetical protein